MCRALPELLRQPPHVAPCRAMPGLPTHAPLHPIVRTTLKLSAFVTGATFDPSTKAAYLAALRAKLPREAGPGSSWGAAQETGRHI